MNENQTKDKQARTKYVLDFSSETNAAFLYGSTEGPKCRAEGKRIGGAEVICRKCIFLCMGNYGIWFLTL